MKNPLEETPQSDSIIEVSPHVNQIETMLKEIVKLNSESEMGDHSTPGNAPFPESVPSALAAVDKSQKPISQPEAQSPTEEISVAETPTPKPAQRCETVLINDLPSFDFSPTEFVDPLLNSRIIIIDDVIENVQVAKFHLEAAGYTNIEFEQYPENVIARLLNGAPDLVLMDVRMPEFTGIELLQEIRCIQWLSDVPVVFLTGATDAETKKRTLELGADGFIRKPIDPHELALTVKNVLASRAYYKQHREEQTFHQAAANITSNSPSSDDLNFIESSYADDPGFVPILLRFAARLEDEISNLRALLTAGNLDQLMVATHTLKGTSGNLGYAPLFEALSSFDEAIKSGEQADMESAFELVEELAKRTR